MSLEISGIYVINLDSRPERWRLFLDGTKHWETAFGKKPERISAIAGVALPGYDKKPWFAMRVSERRKKSWGGKAGCILSHRKAIQKASDQKWNNVLIIEDDAIIDAERVRVWKDEGAPMCANLPEDWAAIYLCATNPLAPCRIVVEGPDFKIMETAGVFGTVAYLLNGRVFNRILKELPNQDTIWAWVARHKTIDRWFSQNLMRFGKVYVFAPSVIGHRKGPSDITMTPESEWAFDFTLKNIRLTHSSISFVLQRCAKGISNAFRRYASWLRLAAKWLRGL